MSRYVMTLAELRQSCKLLATIDVAGGGSLQEELIGKNARGEIVVRVKGKVTPGRVKQFNDAYAYAVAQGLIKPESKGETSGN